MSSNSSYDEYKQGCKAAEQRLFGSNVEAANAFFDDSDVSNDILSELNLDLCPDFNKMISILISRKQAVYVGGKEDVVLNRTKRRYLVLFDFDIPLAEKQREIQKYCRKCHADLALNERAYYFMDTTSFATRGNGILVTDRGFYFSKPPRIANPLLYQNITSMPCGSMNSMDIFYNGKNAKASLLYDQLLNHLLVFTCAFFKYGQF